MLIVSKISKTYYSKKGADCQALKNVSFSLGNSGLYFVLGKSGCGKSTLLNILGGLDKADSGEISYNGKEFSLFSKKDFERYRNETVGFVFQDYNLIDNFNVYENVDIALSLQSATDKDKLISQALKQVGLEGYEKRKISELSGGQKQRVAIARAIVKNSSIILADEPTGNLDSDTGKDILDLLKNLSADKLVIVVTHDKENAELYGDGIISLKDGEIVDFNVKSEKQEKNLNECKEEKSRKPRLSFGYKFRFAIHNLLSKKWRSILAILAATLSFVLVGMAQLLATTDVENNIAKTAENIQKNYFVMKNFDGFSEYYVPIYNDINNNNVYIDYLDKNDIPYLRRGADNIIINNSKHEDFKVFERTYIINSIEDFGKMNLELYDGYLPLDDEGIYITDYYIDFLLKSDAKFEDGETFAFSQMAGKTLIQKVNVGVAGIIEFSNKILGIVKTDYRNILSEDVTISEGNKQDFKEIGGAIFISKGKHISKFYNENLTYLSGKEEGIELKVHLSSGQQSNVSAIVAYEQPTEGFNAYEYALTKEGYQKLTDISLAENEILMSFNLYNALFGEEINPVIPEFEKTFEEVSQGKLQSPKHADEKISLSLMCSGIDKNFLDLQDKTIKGVIVTSKYYGDENALNNYEIMLNGNELVAGFDKEFYYYSKSGTEFIFYSNEYETSSNVLNDLRDCYGIALRPNSYQVQDCWEVFYINEETDKENAVVFALMASVAFVITILLLMWQITFDITSRKKEIGILKALGTSNTNIMKIYVLESILIGFAVSILSLIIMSIGIPLLNKEMVHGLVGFVYIMANAVTWILVGACPILFTFILSLIPIAKISKMNPINIIKD